MDMGDVFDIFEYSSKFIRRIEDFLGETCSNIELKDSMNAGSTSMGNRESGG
jgi:hypothetical protein